MIVQTYKTICEGCEEEVTSTVAVFTGENEVVMDFLDDTTFECECGCTTAISIEKRVVSEAAGDE
ncbi:hypothetical protein [Geomicrobium sp. JCM 19037]|uniref:hypothetical protein n=1 Tax=Geomicrobium sp. JCM 19037 TaxID=1460634 RepID=UPI0005A7BD1F|nr:hypothetical protein [Geomicrobium sp. JCM 19037]